MSLGRFSHKVQEMQEWGWQCLRLLVFSHKVQEMQEWGWLLSIQTATLLYLLSFVAYLIPNYYSTLLYLLSFVAKIAIQL